MAATFESEENNRYIHLTNWISVLEDLGGSPDGLKNDIEEFTVADVLHEIRKQNGGSVKILNELLRKDTMSCTHYDIANLYWSMMQDLYIRQASTQKIFKYNLQTQLWEEPRCLKGDFICVMTAYMDLLDIGEPNKIMFTCKDEDYFKQKRKYQTMVRQDATINSIINIFKSIVPEVDTKFDLEPEYKTYISFANGIYNMKDNSFRPRNRFDTFTKALDFDYKSVYKYDAFAEIDDFFKKIQPDREQRNFTTSYLKYCLTGGNPKCIFKMNIGYTAANGKSSEMNIHEMVFPIYTYELNKTTFSKNCSKVHKYMNKLVTHPIRLAYINELDDSKLDDDFLKKVVDGKKLELEKMYSTVTEESVLQCKIITTSNKDPNMDVDPGVIRRLTIQHYDSQFLPDISQVDPSNNKYLADPLWAEDRFCKDSYKLAYFHYLLQAPSLFVPKVNKMLVKEFVEENDTIMGTLTEHFEVTADLNDKVHQQQVLSVFPNMQKQKLNRELKRHGIVYDKHRQINGLRKVYLGLKSLEIQLNENDPE